MQDVAREITALLEPSQPLGYRLLLFGGVGSSAVIFESKAVPFKGGLGYLVRSITSEARDGVHPPLSERCAMFAPTEDALKFLFRRAYDLDWYYKPRAWLMPPQHTGYNRHCNDGAVCVDLCVEGTYDLGDHDSRQERTLRETVAALTVMHAPEGLKW